MSWDEKWTWGHPDFYIFFVSYHDLNDEMHLTAEPTRDIVWMPLRRGVEEPRIGSTQVNMPPAPATVVAANPAGLNSLHAAGIAVERDRLSLSRL